LQKKKKQKTTNNPKPSNPHPSTPPPTKKTKMEKKRRRKPVQLLLALTSLTLKSCLHKADWLEKENSTYQKQANLKQREKDFKSQHGVFGSRMSED